MRHRPALLGAVVLALALLGAGQRASAVPPGHGVVGAHPMAAAASTVSRFPSGAPRLLPPMPGLASVSEPGLGAPPGAGAPLRPGPGRLLARRSSGDAGRHPQAWRPRPLLAAGIGLAVTGATVAYWYHDRAEGAYARYLRSAGPARQQAAIDRAEDHDRVAGAAFLMMEVGLGLTAWTVFF